MVIVTSNHYIIANKIQHITLDENTDFVDIRSKGGRYKTIVRPLYTITVVYEPDSGSNSGNGSFRDYTRECIITLRSKVDAHRIYKDLVQQIREQMPDQLYLDQAMENLLKRYDPEAFSSSEEKQLYKLKEAMYDGETDKVRKPRKEKRRSKKVLRRTKSSSSRSSK
jgi:hypothetical protein